MEIIERLLRNVPIFIGSLAGIFMAFDHFWIGTAFFILAVINQNALYTTEGE